MSRLMGQLKRVHGIKAKRLDFKNLESCPVCSSIKQHFTPKEIRHMEKHLIAVARNTIDVGLQQIDGFSAFLKGAED